MNNKGVTLVELLIVIVVIGIISAFAIPAVGSIVSNSQQSSVYNDALQLENAAKLYCTENPNATGCAVADATAIDASTLASYVDALDLSVYDTAEVVLTASGWDVFLDGGTLGETNYEFLGGIPSDVDKDSATPDNSSVDTNDLP